MRRLPWSIQNALDNRSTQGPDAANTYWKECMTPHQRNSADLWIMRYRPDILEACGQGPQGWRFASLIEALYAEKEAKET